MTGTYIPAIYAKIEEFLAERVLSSNDGFAPVGDDDLELLYDIVIDLISAKWQGDADGDAPVSVKLIDRNVYQPLNFALVTYRSLSKKQNLQDIVFNVGQAISEMQLCLDLNRIEERNAKRNDRIRKAV